ncbi:hypothetical protein BDV33DRAFT_209769 [Aspergillus novoparasiticus]|uniref:Uncharacterized protein n=1 Tax=Aspergillus novoparasiticus TaxID=986946 RepID=A0A5N6E951_9EURO|nr:hypothetical protein BDV33DRAFT_209769 [Aspergillus novoparasiticus]
MFLSGGEDIASVERATTGMEPEDGEYNVHLSSSGSSLVANGMIIHVSTTQTSNLHKQLRLEMDGNSVKIKSNMESSVSGLYVVGDANNDGSTNTYHAMWSAKLFMPKQEYPDSVPSAIVAAAGGNEGFYRHQVEDLKFPISDGVKQMYKVLGG